MIQPVQVPGQLGVKPEWLASRTEPVLEPEIAIIDAHHHLWDPPGSRYLLPEFLADVGDGHRISASVAVECHSMYRAHGPEELKPVGETEFLAGAAAQSDSGIYGPARLCAAIVGFVDFSLGEKVAPVLAAHSQAAGGRLRGVRGRTSSHEDAGINKWRTPAHVLLADATRRAIRSIADLGLSLDIWAYHTQLNDVLDICCRYPDLAVIVNHAGGPLGCGPFLGRRAEAFPVWARGIRSLGKLPNTYIKISGLGQRFTGFDFHLQPHPPASDDLVAAWGPYVETCLNAFGPQRCMFASNFPPDKASCSYRTLWNAFKKLSRSYSSAEREALFAATAARAYRIDLN